ncbi:hypothetical protein CU097_009903 [Rhizopus azygosporus]|uniref:F-box domain-containing protein n=2 Tax=Rhizopus TaxID=4842 RepID=A0A367JRU2_RHIAZ|nr:hypothetical protein BCV71DRAFT_255530 [Rhizopus microsporus]RCH92674.1 hypothetical protein CU097_009903 [Rhizopus azygosporus]
MTERLWLGNDGKYQVYASYVCLFQDKKVKLRKPNGSVIAVPLNLLCEEDIAFIATQSGHLKNESMKQNDRPKSEKYILPTLQLSSSPEYSSSEDTVSTVASNKVHSEQHLVSSPETLQQVAPVSNHQQVRHMSPDESKRMIPKRSFSSMTEQFKRQTFIDSPLTDAHNLAYLPSKVIGSLLSFLDTRSRLRLSMVNRRLHRLVFRPETWTSVWFSHHDNDMIDDAFLYRLAVFLQRRDLHNAIKHMILDGTNVTASSILLVVKHLENVETLSIQSCWNIHTYELATELTRLAKSSKRYSCKISRMTIGKVLHRGPTQLEQHEAPLDSKSFGQDIWYINAGLNRLSNKNVVFDVALCNTCHVGAAGQEFHCMSCGILPLFKCVGCAPRCDRCGSRSCGLPTCTDPKLKVDVTQCGRCRLPLALCNDISSVNCQQARQPCAQCHGLFHVRCRTNDGVYTSNQCSTCGTVACPNCELIICAGKCKGQWCRHCVTNVHIAHCKCIVIHGKANHATKTLGKRLVCGQCQRTCECGISHFCDRCLQVHSEKCQTS